MFCLEAMQARLRSQAFLARCHSSRYVSSMANAPVSTPVKTEQHTRPLYVNTEREPLWCSYDAPQVGGRAALPPPPAKVDEGAKGVPQYIEPEMCLEEQLCIEVRQHQASLYVNPHTPVFFTHASTCARFACGDGSLTRQMMPSVCHVKHLCIAGM